MNNYLLGQKPPAFDLLYWNSVLVNARDVKHVPGRKTDVSNSRTTSLAASRPRFDQLVAVDDLARGEGEVAPRREDFGKSNALRACGFFARSRIEQQRGNSPRPRTGGGALD